MKELGQWYLSVGAALWFVAAVANVRGMFREHPKYIILGFVGGILGWPLLVAALVRAEE